MIMCQIKDEDRGEDGKMKKRPICTYVDNSKLRDMCKIVENKNKNLEIESNQNVAVENNQTETQMTHLKEEEKISALARLLGGSKITEAVLANAKEMLALAKQE